jgi:translation initiation factor RLI1
LFITFEKEEKKQVTRRSPRWPHPPCSCPFFSIKSSSLPLTISITIFIHLQVRPLEETFKFGHFFSPIMNEGDFEAKPSVLLLGQYSTGKSTFIKYLLGRDYPGIHIGPEPTTDRFVVVMHGPEVGDKEP